jgi:hypothetical protein
VNLALVGEFDRPPLGRGWTPSERKGARRVVAVFGGVEVHEPKPGAA